MSIKLKALGLGLLALLTMGAFAAANATAEGGGHFTSDSPTGKTWITGTEEQGGTTPDTTELAVQGLIGIHCKHASYVGTISANTVESVTISPTYKECTTVPSGTKNIVVDVNGCTYTFTIAKKKANVHNTVDIVCPAGIKGIVITHPECEVTVPPQTLKGVAYIATTESGKESITVEATIGINATPKFTTQFHKGICTLLGTTHEAAFTGSVKVTGFEDKGPEEGQQVNITATGIE